MFWKFCTAYIIFIVATSIYSAVFVDPLAATDLGKTSCIAMAYAVTVKYFFPVLDSWREYKRKREMEVKS